MKVSHIRTKGQIRLDLVDDSRIYIDDDRESVEEYLESLEHINEASPGLLDMPFTVDKLRVKIQQNETVPL